MTTVFEFVRRLTPSCGLVATAVLLLPSCEGEELAPAILEFEGQEVQRANVDPCSIDATGCPCDAEGEQVECGSIKEKRGDYMICKRGVRTCTDEMWSECLPEANPAAD